MATAKRGQASIHIAADPVVIYDLLSDVTRMGQWSPECYRCEWLDRASAAVEGVRFRGYNRLGRYRWATTAVVTVARRGREFAKLLIPRGHQVDRGIRQTLRRIAATVESLAKVEDVQG